MIYNLLIVSNLILFSLLNTSIRRYYFQNVTDNVKYFFYIINPCLFEAAKVCFFISHFMS
jgi:hypothetical protein